MNRILNGYKNFDKRNFRRIFSPALLYIVRPHQIETIIYNFHTTNIDHFMEEDFQIPDQYICPISQQLMNDPVSVITGHSFERKNIQQWLNKNNTNPVTNLPLPDIKLIPNIPLKQLIQAFKQKQKEKFRVAKISNLMTSFTEREKEMRQKYRSWQQRFQQKIHQLPNEQFSFGNYKGEIQDDQPHGDGVMNYSDGSTYGGQWENGERCGFGRIVANQLRYYGQWKNGKLNGVGWVLSENTNKIIFRCEWKNGKRDGFGMHYDYENGKVYTGYWKQNKRHGQGKQENSLLGQIYIGQWKDGVKHGEGQSRFQDGTKRKERWNQGQLQGDFPLRTKNACCRLI